MATIHAPANVFFIGLAYQRLSNNTISPLEAVAHGFIPSVTLELSAEHRGRMPTLSEMPSKVKGPNLGKKRGCIGIHSCM